MNGTAGVVASVVVLKKRRKSNTSSFTVVKEKVEVAANVVANQLLGSVVANIRKKRAYCGTCDAFVWVRWLVCFTSLPLWYCAQRCARIFCSAGYFCWCCSCSATQPWRSMLSVS